MNSVKSIGLHHNNSLLSSDFCQTTFKQKSDNKQDNRCTNSLLYSSLAALGAVSLGVLFIRRKKQNSQNKKLSVNEILNSLPANIAEKVRYDYDNPMHKNIIEHIIDKEEFNKIKLFLALLKNNCFNTAPPPNIIKTNLDETNSKMLSNILFRDCGQSVKNLKYTKDPDKFVQALDITADNLESSNKFLGIYIENYKEFIKDLNNFSDKSVKNRFQNLLEHVKDKNVTFWVKDDLNNNNHDFSNIVLNFDNKIDLKNIKDAYENSNTREVLKFYTVADSKLQDFVGDKKTLAQIDCISSLYAHEPVNTNFLMVNQDKSMVNTFLQTLTSDTKNNITEIDTSKPKDELLKQLKAVEAKAEKDFYCTGKLTVLHYSDFKLINSVNEIQDQIKCMQNKEYIINVSETANIKEIPNSLLDKNYVFFINQTNDDSGSILNEIIEKNIEQPFKYIGDNGNHFIKTFLKPLAYEKAGESYYEIPNGILFYGENREHLLSTIDSLKHCCGVNYKKIHYFDEQPLNVINELVKAAEEAEEVFNQTGVRTIVEIENLDSMLINQKNRNDIIMIGRFKGLTERLSKNYHTTIVTATTKPLELFEPASIAPHRFGIQVKID